MDNLNSFISVIGIVGVQFALMGGIIAIVIGIVYWQRQNQRRAWGELAALTGLQMEEGSWWTPARVTGTYRGRSLTLDTFTRGSGKHRHTYTRVTLFVNNTANVYLALYEENLFTKIGKFFGMEDVQVGDEDIDRRFRIKSKPETFAAKVMLNSQLRGQLLEARQLNVEADGREITFEQLGLLTETDYLKFIFDLLSSLADQVERG